MGEEGGGMSDPITDAITELRAITVCQCGPEWAGIRDGHGPDCTARWREDVDALAAELTYRAVRIKELERDLSDAQDIVRMLGRKLAGPR